MRAAIYLRISRDDQQTGLAVERQREDCHEILRTRGWTLAGEYVDNAVSAFKRTTRRPAYDRLVAAYDRGEFEALVCWDLDRLTRQPRQLEDWIDAAEDRGLVVVTANGEADLATDNGRLFARIKASVARSEIERKGARQARANVQRIASGRPAPGRRRYGYEPDGVTPREAEAAVVRRVYSHVADGGSLRSLTRALIEERVDPAPGKGWSEQRVRYIVNNPAYTGSVPRLGEALPSSVLVPLVDKVVAEEARAILADPSRQTGPGPTPRHLGSGIARCGVCAGPMMNLANAYRCRADASHPTIKREYLDARLRREVALAFLTTPRESFPGQPTTQLAPLLEEVRRNDAAATATANDRDEGLLSPAAARTRLLRLRDDRIALEARLDAARAERAASATVADAAESVLAEAEHEVEVGAFLGPMTDAVVERFTALDLDRQRDTVRALLDVSVNPGRDPRRVVVWHTVATHLNADYSDEPDRGGDSVRPTGSRRAPRPRAE